MDWDGQRGFRFELDDQIVDVLAPDGLGRAARTAGKLETIQIPGGTQALERIEVVEIVVAGVASRVRRPTLLGALLLKARALPVHSRPEDQREDIITLLALVEDPDAIRPSLTQAERRWLRSIENTLALDDPTLPARFSLARLRAARVISWTIGAFRERLKSPRVSLVMKGSPVRFRASAFHLIYMPAGPQRIEAAVYEASIS